MATDVVSLPPARAGAPAPARGTGALTRRASLNAAASLLDYFAKAGVGLVVTPILVRGLGRSLFGVWEMLSQLTGYMSPADGRANEALRLIIAQRQASPDDAAKRRSVGAALAVWAIMLPLIAAGRVTVDDQARLAAAATEERREGEEAQKERFEITVPRQ